MTYDKKVNVLKTIFVSSTFKDMQDERNLIHAQVMPSVNYELKKK